ncbi:hypothetical protein [Nocardia gipuzkoensis]
MPEDRPQYAVYYGLTPDRPVAITLPPVEARPAQPLPDAGHFLRMVRRSRGADHGHAA